MLEKIESIREVGSVELDSRLRNVSLRGFPEIKIYGDSDISIREVSSDWINSDLFIPQPSVYRKGFLNRIKKVHELFMEKGINIFHLDRGYDYIAIDSEREETEWTMIPPVIEIVRIDFTQRGRLDYSNLIGEELRRKMEEEGYQLNPELKNLNFKDYQRFSGIHQVPLVCDGSHRIHSGLEKTTKQNLLLINGPKQGFPYYAAPKPYSAVHVVEERPEGGGDDKTHVLTSPGHKLLYRLFPSGGINSGILRTSSERVD